jgi:hypothetical protein
MDPRELESLTEMVIGQFSARDFQDPKTHAGLDRTLARLQRFVASLNESFPPRPDGQSYELTDAHSRQVRQAVLERLA